MASRTDNAPLIVILGVTGSGKSALSLELARLFNGEIIAADSRTVYKGMDVSTAKPTLAERLEIPHHLIDVIYPDESFTVADFKVLANSAITDIASRKKIPILVGGSALYIDSLLYDFSLRPTVDVRLRAQLSEETIDELRQRILDSGLEFPRDSKNSRRLIRTIESGGASSERADLRANTLVIGLYVDRETQLRRISKRVDSMVSAGLVDELSELAKQYGWETRALQTPGCRAFHDFLSGVISLDEAKALFVRNDMNLAKRQYAWFKRNKDVRWIEDKEKVVDLVTTFLNKY